MRQPVTKKKIGFWETKGDLYDRGDDVPESYHSDAHWSIEMEKRVAKFLIKEL